jgi:hypothetical protein
MQKIRRKNYAGTPYRQLLSVVLQPIGDLPLRQYVHSRNEGGGLDSTCMKCFSVVGTNTDELSLLASEREHVCRSESCLTRPS